MLDSFVIAKDAQILRGKICSDYVLAERNFHSYFRRLNILELSELTFSQ